MSNDVPLKINGWGSSLWNLKKIHLKLKESREGKKLTQSHNSQNKKIQKNKQSIS